MNAAQIQGWLAAFTARSLDWLVSTGLSILFVLLVVFAAVRICRAAGARLEKVLTDRAGRSRRLEDPGEAAQRIRTLSELLVKICVTAVWIVGGMIILKEAGIDIAPLIAGAGIVGLAVGFGAQNLVRDIVSGFFIILENQIGVGDVALVNGTGGLVESIGLRTTVLRDASGTVHVFPNGAITSLSNMTKDWSAMVFDIGVAYKEDTDRVAEIMEAVAEGLRADEAFRERILEPMEIMGVDAFGDSAVVIKARIKTKPIQQWSVGREYRRRLKKAFDEQGIEMPFPHRTIYWGEASRPFELLVDREETKKASS